MKNSALYRSLSAFGAVFLAALLAMFGTSLLIVLYLQSLMQPFVHLEDYLVDPKGVAYYEASNGAVFCPGDMVEWHPEVRVVKSVDATVYRSLKKQDGDTTLIAGFRVDQYSLELGDYLLDARDFLLPDDLSPGEYYILNSLSTSGALVTRYKVPFTVEECP